MIDNRLVARIAQVGLRLSLGAAFLSAVASRFGLCGAAGSDWKHFLEGTAKLNWYLPHALIPMLAVSATVLEITFACLLIVGWQVRKAAFGSAALLMWFALAMVVGDGPKAPLDYSVFTAAFGALSLATTYGKEPA